MCSLLLQCVLERNKKKKKKKKKKRVPRFIANEVSNVSSQGP